MSLEQIGRKGKLRPAGETDGWKDLKKIKNERSNPAQTD